MNIAADGTRVSGIRDFLRPTLSRPNGIFTERRLSAHYRSLGQVGPSFPYSVDVRIDTASGTVKVLSGTGEKRRTEEHDLKVPKTSQMASSQLC